jgi:hypothetical protein
MAAVVILCSVVGSARISFGNDWLMWSMAVDIECLDQERLIRSLYDWSSARTHLTLMMKRDTRTSEIYVLHQDLTETSCASEQFCNLTQGHAVGKR